MNWGGGHQSDGSTGCKHAIYKFLNSGAVLKYCIQEDINLLFCCLLCNKAWTVLHYFAVRYKTLASCFDIFNFTLKKISSALRHFFSMAVHCGTFTKTPTLSLFIAAHTAKRLEDDGDTERPRQEGSI